MLRWLLAHQNGTILPTTMAELAVSNGYRTANNGTAWAYFPFIADYFDFEEYYTTYEFKTAMNYLKTDNDNDGNSDYCIVVSCGSGLFTTGGHYIVLVANTDETITVYDPYLYSGKFTTASRKSAGVTVSGNLVYVSESSFETYANYKCFWIFSNDNGEGNTNTSSGSSNSTTNVSYTRYVSTSSLKLNVRTGAGTSYSVKTSLAKGTEVTVTNLSGNWSYITSPVTGWVSSSYLSSTKVTETTDSSSSYTTGSYKVTASLLNVRSEVGTSYIKKTYKQLTANARAQNKALGNYYANGYKKGVICTVTQVKGNWGKTASGWIYLKYCTKI